MMNTKQYTLHLADVARQIVAESGIDIRQPIIRPVLRRLAKVMCEQTGAHLTTCKRHIDRAIRIARGEMVERRWGGPRPFSGRPRKDEDE
jgi:hypothetical protein